MNTKQTTTSKVNTRLLAILTALCLMLGIAPIVVLAEDDSPVSNVVESWTSSKCTVELYDDATLRIRVTDGDTGSMYNRHSPTNLPPWHDREIKHVIIEDGVTNIGNSAFYGLATLTDIVIPDSVASISKNAFCGCTSLTSINLPEAYKNIISGNTFQDCTSLTSIVIPEGVTSIAGEAFTGCTSLKDVYCYADPTSFNVVLDAFDKDVVFHVRCDKLAEFKQKNSNNQYLSFVGDIHDYQNGTCTRCGHIEGESDTEPIDDGKITYADEQRVSTDDGACFCIKFSYLDGSMTETQQNLYKVDTNKYRIDGELDTEGMFKATFKFPNKHGGRNFSYCYAGIYADPNDLTNVATGNRFVKENTNLEEDTLIEINPSSLLPGTTYYFVLESTSNEGNQPFGANVVFELKTKGEAPVPVPELVSSKGKDLIAKTYTDLELKNAPGDGYLYKFIVYNSTTNQWYKLQDYSDLTTFSWYTGPAGVKNLYVDIKNKNDATDVTRVALTGVNVTDSGLKATLAIEPTGELAKETHATLTATANGGTEPYEYKFIVYNDTSKQWYLLKNYGPESTFDWYTGPAGTKTLYVDVKDANGVVVRQPLENIVVK